MNKTKEEPRLQMFQLCLQIQSAENLLFLAMSRADMENESKLRQELHVLLDRKLDLQYAEVLQVMTDLRRKPV